MIFLCFDSPAILIDGNKDYNIPPIKDTDPKQVFKFVAAMDCCHDQHCIWGAAKWKIANTPSSKSFPNLLCAHVLIGRNTVLKISKQNRDMHGIFW